MTAGQLPLMLRGQDIQCIMSALSVRAAATRQTIHNASINAVQLVDISAICLSLSHGLLKRIIFMAREHVLKSIVQLMLASSGEGSLLHYARRRMRGKKVCAISTLRIKLLHTGEK